MMYRHFITLFSISSGALYNNALNHSKKCKYTISFSASHNLSFIVRRPFRCKARDAAFFIRRIPARPYSVRSDGRVCPAQNRQKGDPSADRPTGRSAFGSPKKQQIPNHVIDNLARCLLPKIQTYFETENGQLAFQAWAEDRKNTKPAVGQKGRECRKHRAFLETRLRFF